MSKSFTSVLNNIPFILTHYLFVGSRAHVAYEDIDTIIWDIKL